MSADVLAAALSDDPAAVPCDDLGAWLPRQRAVTARHALSIDRAVAAGFAADRLGWAFVGGYHAALGRLAPSLDPEVPAALAATEDGGAHPRAIATTLRPTADNAWILQGAKGFVTLGRSARTLLVVASTGADELGRNALRVARVDARAPGVTLADLPAVPFAPEVTHARATFDGVRVAAADLLPGDGYTEFLKPFRTIEDLHVLAASLGYLTAVARRHALAPSLVAALAAHLVTARALAAAPPASPSVHVALDGLFALARGTIASLEGAWPDGAERARWERDRGILHVADRARAQRFQRAWGELGGRSAA